MSEKAFAETPSNEKKLQEVRVKDLGRLIYAFTAFYEEDRNGEKALSTVWVGKSVVSWRWRTSVIVKSILEISVQHYSTWWPVACCCKFRRK